ncbi:hypothetical protein BTA51_15085 [Hahella sp. CCB-MM4]|uniref:FHA domain-containing protein n=1 Tax=Hahella sp. (strain CCB-MM4) TaxID=1926491 RepID=UPI000B9B35DB|nr:FHA domain-containing protein [Hahella sp. CCB-MM4]OZG72449.1 hypothetical protein BTA51_15085 [Hahella sp. CCB-MM4]
MEVTFSVLGTDSGSVFNLSYTFDYRGGLIGHSTDCDWCLPVGRNTHPRHAKVIFSDGEFLIEGLAADGLIICRNTMPLAQGGRYAIRHGDQFRIGSYQVLAQYHSDIFLPPWLNKGEVIDLADNHRKRKTLPAEFKSSDFDMLLALLGEEKQGRHH